MSSSLKVASLFTGIGGFDLAAERLGGRVVLQAEIEPSAQKVLRAAFPQSRLEADARLVDLRGVDLVTMGFPCQGLSSAAATPKGQGLLDPTSPSAVVWAVLSQVFKAQPPYLLLENADSLTTAKFKADLDALLNLLEQNGYHAHTVTLNAGCYGSAMRRVRTFILARRNPWVRPHVPESVRWLCSTPLVGVANQQGGAMWCAQPSVTKQSGAYTLMVTPTEVRTLTPEAVETLFGFPLRWTHAARSTSDRYARLGNAVAVPAAEAALRLLLGARADVRAPSYSYSDLYSLTVPAGGGAAGSAFGRLARSMKMGGGYHNAIETSYCAPVYAAWMKKHRADLSPAMFEYIAQVWPRLPAPLPWPTQVEVVMRQGRVTASHIAEE